MQLPFRFPFRRLGHCVIAALLASLLAPLGMLALFGLLALAELVLVHWFAYPRRLHDALRIELVVKLVGYPGLLLVLLACDYYGIFLFEALFELLLPRTGDAVRFALTFLPIAIALEALLFGFYTRKRTPLHISRYAIAVACLWIYCALLLLWLVLLILLIPPLSLQLQNTHYPILSFAGFMILFACPLTLGHALWCTLPWLLEAALPAPPLYAAPPELGQDNEPTP